MSDTNGTTTLSSGSTTRTIAPRNPDAPISDAQRSRMREFKLRVKRDMTQGQASVAISRYLDRNPEVRERLETERRERQQARWVALRTRYEQASRGRCRSLGKPEPSEGQIGGLMVRAFRRPQGDVLRGEVLGALELGVSAAQASAMIREMDDTPVQGARPQAGPEQERMAA